MQQKDTKSFRINEQIKAQEARVIDENGQMLGVIPVKKALELAIEASLDLVEVSPNTTPIVCKIADFGKLRYEMQKKAADAKKKQKVIELKEVKLSINIGKGDFDTKIRHLQKFILEGDKVKVSIRMRGREITHVDLARAMMEDVINQTQEYTKVELGPRLEGMQMVLILVKK